ncbi:kinase domain protein [Ceratobasidium sp. AG-Ba]|nr:kinase domain protein [Ceratobasidium sp. AG-Ba]
MQRPQRSLARHRRDSLQLASRRSRAASKYRSQLPQYVNKAQAWSSLDEGTEETLRSLDALAHSYVKRNMFEDALPLQQEALDRRLNIWSHGHPEILECKYSLAYTYAKLFQLQLAEELARQAWSGWNNVLGPNHPRTYEASELLSVIRYKNNQRRRYKNGRAEDVVRNAPGTSKSSLMTIRIVRTEMDDEIDRTLEAALAQISCSAVLVRPDDNQGQGTSSASNLKPTAAQAYESTATSSHSIPGVKNIPIVGVQTTKECGLQHLRVVREAHVGYVLSKIKHPNIMELLGVANFRGQVALISPWMPNGTLAEYVRKNTDVDGWDLAFQVSEGLAAIHDIGMVHGDLKAANVFVSELGVPKIGDFGNSIFSGGYLDFTGTSNIGGGTSRWMAPELLFHSDHDGGTECDRSKEADIYALGMTILEIMTRNKPYLEFSSEPYVTFLVIQGIHPKQPADWMKYGKSGEERWDLIKECWRMRPDSRPVIHAIRNRFDMAR